MDDQQVDLGTAWQQIVEDLQPNQRAWLRPSVPMTLHENTAIIAVPNDFTRNQLEGRLRNHIEDALSEGFGREIRMLVTVNPALESEAQPQIDESTDAICRLCRQMPGMPSTPTPAVVAEPRAAAQRRRAPSLRAGDPAQPEVHLRDLRHRLVQPVPPRRRRRGRRGAGQGVQPAARLRRVRPGQDPPAPRDRPLRPQPLQQREGALRLAARSSPTSSSTRSATTARTGSSGATATSTCC